MMSALSDLSKYKTNSSQDDAQLRLVANLTTDNVVTNADLQGLLVLLANGGGSGGGSLTAAPEPTTLVLALFGLSMGVVQIRWSRLRRPDLSDTRRTGLGHIAQDTPS